MVLKFKQVNLEGIMELNGTIHFPDGKAIVLYGINQAGKTNIINAIRYAFLRDLKARGKPKEEYDEWALPRREELIFDDEGKIKILFEHNNVPYVLERKILSHGRREESTLYQIDLPDQRIDVSTFLKNRLKVSLLDALFIPEIIGGFRRLYSGDIDKSIGELFKEIANLRQLTKSFIFRLNKMKSAAQAEIKNIETSYTEFCKEIQKLCPLVSDWNEYKNLITFEVDKTSQKISDLKAKTVKIIAKLEEESLVKDFGALIEKAKQYSQINKLINEQKRISNNIVDLKNVNYDLKRLEKWRDSISRIKDVKSRIKPPPKLKDEKLMENVLNLLKIFERAKNFHKEALKLASEEKVKLENVEDTIKELKKVVFLLKKEIGIGREIPASITKIQGKVYAVVDAKLLVRDTSLADISNQPIPKGKLTEKKKYLPILDSKIKKLKTIKKYHKEEQTLFKKFVEEGLPTLNRFIKNLKNKTEKLEDEIKCWSEELASLSSSFTGKKIKPKKIKKVQDVESYIKSININVSSSKDRYLKKVNLTLEQLGIPQIEELDVKKLQSILKQISEQIKNLPLLKKLEEFLGKEEQEWQKKCELYQDYMEVPSFAHEISSILQMILEKCFDEQKLKAKVASTYMDIIKIMQERNLIKATTEVTPQQLKGVVRYKGKLISHPSGSEKAFFSLAILTALAHYFQTPVLIDEVANNLDSKNLKAFFELIKEFKDKYGIQYVLSVKDTRDFDFDTWVKDLRDDICVYGVQDKHVQMMAL
ncbi:MAG: hypothetical protein QXO15_00325 [Nitrososphaerota archaeon]